MEKNKRNRIIGLSIGILIVLIIVVSGTYAYWQITKTQETPNDIVAACLNLSLNDASAENTGINLDSVWPISDEEGASLTGYTFTVTNNCNEEINYIVGLNRVEEENYLQDSSIKLQLDDNSAFTYSDLSDVEYVDPDNTEYTARASKQVSVETIGANETNEHTIRVWVSDEAPVTEQSKTFLGQVFITGGQGIYKEPSIEEDSSDMELGSCFTVGNNGVLLGYDESCGLDVKVPAEINGIQVKEINVASLVNSNITTMSDSDSAPLYYLVKDEANYSSYEEHFKANMCEDPTNCDVSEILITLDKYNELNPENVADYYNANVDLNTGAATEVYANITSLDLSDAIYLEEIKDDTFNLPHSSFSSSINDSCVYSEDGQEYTCKGSLKNVVLPANGVLTTIGASAFRDNQLTEVVIPSSVTTIKDYAFYDNPLTSVIIVNTEGNVTLGENVFPSTVTITYNPN